MRPGSSEVFYMQCKHLKQFKHPNQVGLEHPPLQTLCLCSRAGVGSAWWSCSVVLAAAWLLLLPPIHSPLEMGALWADILTVVLCSLWWVCSLGIWVWVSPTPGSPKMLGWRSSDCQAASVRGAAKGWLGA